MKALVTLFIALCTVSAFAATPAPAKKEPRVDSVVYDKGMEWKVFPAKGGVVAFAVEGQNCYIATAENVTCFNYKSGVATAVPKLGILEAAGVTCVAADGQGNVWFGTKSGVAMKSKSGFSNFTAGKELPSDDVTALCASGDGSVWVGTDAGAANYKNGSWKTYTAKQGLAADKIQAMVAGAGATVWFGTPKGISSFDGVKWASYTMAMDNCLSWNDTKALAWDPRSKTLWAAVGDQDVNSFNGTTWSQYMNITAGILSIMADTQSRIWFGLQTGLLKFNGEEWISDAAKIGVPAAMVNQMYRDNSGNLWFGSDKGVIFVNNPYPY